MEAVREKAQSIEPQIMWSAARNRIGFLCTGAVGVSLDARDTSRYTITSRRVYLVWCSMRLIVTSLLTVWMGVSSLGAQKAPGCLRSIGTDGDGARIYVGAQEGTVYAYSPPANTATTK